MGEEYERAVPLCPECKGMLRAERLVKKRWDDPEHGPWTCDLHGEVKPVWEFPEDLEKEE